ncbi:G-protein coupled receptor moody-like [Asterias rubens]|uniref:G-protein coupled receptor moody-like n=1 Tax=Asterias rubens TaxID=7604 RepID=UPI00145554F6|nr:G-protein coupled receptor moody-like [Asterias rubens]
MDRFESLRTTLPTVFQEANSDEDVATKESDAFTKFVTSLYCIICVVGITGNLLVAIVLLRVPSLRSNTSDFLVHLSLVDFMACVMVIPAYLLPNTHSPPNPGFFGEFWCRFYTSGFLFWFFTMTSVLGLTVNLERYVAIVHPHKYKTLFIKRNRYIMIAACWASAAVLDSSSFLTHEEDEVVGCHFKGWSNRGAQATLGLFSFTGKFFVPFAVMILAQLKVISTLSRQVKMLTARTASMGVNPRDQREMWQLRASQTLVKTLLACVITFGVCWTPNQVLFLLFNIGVHVTLGDPIHRLTVILAVGNSCVNPVIYTMTNKPFRKGIRELFCKQRDSNQVADGVATGTVSETVSNAQEQ